LRGEGEEESKTLFALPPFTIVRVGNLILGGFDALTLLSINPEFVE